MTANSRGTKAAPPPVQQRLSALPRPAAGVRYAALVAVCALCYSNSLWGEFVHDDIWAITNNPDVRPGSSLRSIFTNDFWGKRMADNTSHKSYRPLCILTFKLNILLGGMTPFYFHLVNVFLHCMVTVLLMLTCEQCVFEDSNFSFLTALLFSVHPIHTEAVSGIVGRADVLAGVLFLLSFLSYIRSVSASRMADEFPPTVSVLSLALSLLLGTCAMLVKETGVTVFGVCILYDFLVLCRKPLILHLSRSRLKELDRISSPFVKRACVISLHVTVIMFFRLWLMGGSMPLFSEQDNPTSFSPYLLTRFLTYCYLLAFNAWLLLAPIVLCYDWQVGSIPLVESLWDGRNIASLALALVMLALILNCVTCLQKMKGKEVLVGLLFLVFPFIPASNLFFRVGFVVAERVLYMPRFVCVCVFFFNTSKSGIQTLPHNAKVHYNYANFLKDRGRNQEAIYHYKTALRLYPRHASALNNLGTLTHQAEEAEVYYRRALDINPQHNRALFNLGNLLKSQGKEEEAERMLKESIRFGPHFADAYSSLASLYADQGHSKEANEIYTKGIENCPDSSDLHNNYGVFLVDTGHGDRAAFHYQEAVRLKPSHYVAMVNLGRLLRSSNDNKEAELWYKRALQVVRKVDILTPLGALYYNTGRYEEALEVYREAATLQPDSTDIWLALAQVLAMAGRSAEAEKMTLGIISKTSNCIECYRLLSAIYSKQGNHTEALDALKAALQQEPSDPAVRAELHFSMGNQLREMNELDRAFQSYKLAVELKPDQSQAWMNMGGIQHIKGDYAAARMYYQRALLLSPGSKLLKENLAKLDRLEKKLQGA
ncbi:transmembrane and TPR repeat-containing protein 1-like [Sinocyclocheilus rhinocerous]|uniref:transmembrane and TPR repeat-containing protein 1-like n=1 Tax=Sinocyclocheilus rhinocerous TaxID=307959 RepID=UPI0007B9AF42|nr:PREDICTED: transmembrane and TPR repeat-containing protein 1-like [Sinocyclocheilus rhinocerous]